MHNIEHNKDFPVPRDIGCSDNGIGSRQIESTYETFLYKPLLSSLAGTIQSNEKSESPHSIQKANNLLEF